MLRLEMLRHIDIVFSGHKNIPYRARNISDGVGSLNPSRIIARTSRWILVDWIVAVYSTGTGILLLFCYQAISHAAVLLLFRLGVLVLLFWLPPRGASWERAQPGERSISRGARKTARFVRYIFPALLVIPFFEEVEYTVNAVAPQTPYWFEPYLYSADQALFGELPAILLSEWTTSVIAETMYGFYFSYFVIIIIGLTTAFAGPRNKYYPGLPGPAFEATLTCMVLGYFASFIWYPFLPARGPWENPELMAELRSFEGKFFVPFVQWINEQGSVSGGCFPSSHVSGSVGLILGLGLSGKHRRLVLVLTFLSAGMSVSCVYTRYHHAVDVIAGILAGMLGAGLGYWLMASRWPRGPRRGAGE